MDMKEYKAKRQQLIKKQQAELLKLKKEFLLSQNNKKWGHGKGSILPYAVREIIKGFGFDKEFSIKTIHKVIARKHPNYDPPNSFNLSQCLLRLQNSGFINEVRRTKTRKIFKRGWRDE